jgi:hypothetical protein
MPIKTQAVKLDLPVQSAEVSRSRPSAVFDSIANIRAGWHIGPMWGRLAFLLLLSLLAASPARAVCSGETLQREFQEADLVVRARIVSELNVWDDEPSAAYRARWGDGARVVLYGLRASEVFKGAPGPRINFFEERNSGAFYLDIDRDYLLFLNYLRPSKDRPAAARGALHMRYACGQSKLWNQVPARDLAILRSLSRRRR